VDGKSRRAAITRFEEIQGWQKGRTLAKAVYDVTNNGAFEKDYALRDQIRKASVSIMSNIAEGFRRRSPKEFANFLSIAHGSVAEVQSQLYIALDRRYISDEDFDRLYALAEETSRLIKGFSNSLLRRRSAK